MSVLVWPNSSATWAIPTPLTKASVAKLWRYAGDDQKLILSTHQWLMSTPNEDVPAPGLDVDTAIQKLHYYFGNQRKVRDSEQLAVLGYAYRWLRDSGYESGGSTNRRGPLLSPNRALAQAEAWILADLIRSEFEVDVLHHAAIQHRQVPAGAIVPFLDHLVRSGRIRQSTEEILKGKHSKDSFLAARDRIEFARLSRKKSLGGLNKAGEERLTQLDERMKNYAKQDLGVYISFETEFTAFSKSIEGITLQGEAYHPKDNDKEWKRALFLGKLQQLKLSSKQQDSLTKVFIDEENYPVEAVKRLLSFVEFLALPTSQGLGLDAEAVSVKLAEYRRLPMKSTDGIDRIRTGWRLAQEYAPGWLRGRGHKIFMDNLFDYASPDEFYRLLSIVDLNLRAERGDLYQKRFGLYKKCNPYDGTDHRDDPNVNKNFSDLAETNKKLPELEKRYERWVAIHEELSPFGWHRDPKSFMNEELPNCGKATFDLVHAMKEPPPPLGWDQEYRNALPIICTAHVRAAEKDAISEMKKAQETYQVLADATRLLQRVSNFMSTLPEELALQPAPNQYADSLSEMHAALCLIRIHFTEKRASKLSDKARFFQLSLKSAKNELSKISADAPGQMLTDQVSRLSEGMGALSQAYSGSLRHETWTNMQDVSFTEIFPDSAPPSKQVTRAPGIDVDASKYLVVREMAAAFGLPTIKLEYTHPDRVAPPSAPGFSGLVKEIMHRDQVYRKANLSFGKHYEKIWKDHKEVAKSSPGEWVKRNIDTAKAMTKVVNHVDGIAKKNSAWAEQLMQTSLNTASPATFPVANKVDPTTRLRTLGEELSAIAPKKADAERHLRAAHVARLAAGIAYSNGDTETGDSYAAIGQILGRLARGETDQNKLMSGLTPGVNGIVRMGSKDGAVEILLPNGRFVASTKPGETKTLFQFHPPKNNDADSVEANLRKAQEAVRNTDTALEVLSDALHLGSILTKNPDLEKMSEFTEKLREPAGELKKYTDIVVELAEKKNDKAAAEKESNTLLDKLKLVKIENQAEELERLGRKVLKFPVGLITEKIDEKFVVSRDLLIKNPKEAESRFKSYLGAIKANVNYLKAKQEQLEDASKVSRAAGKFWGRLHSDIGTALPYTGVFGKSVMEYWYNADKLSKAYSDLADAYATKAAEAKRAAEVEQRRHDNLRETVRTVFGFRFRE